jgi:hypothetical protein
VKRLWPVLVVALLRGTVFAQDEKGLTVSGILDSRVTAQAGAGNAASSFGAEEYANVRVQAKVRDAVFYAAFNFIAAAGSYAAGAGSPAPGGGPGTAGNASFSFAAGENYAAGMELERLYFRVSKEHAGFEGGLMRLAFGYGQVFGPSDFLNPKNPLNPDARLRGILGGALSVYPSDSFRLRFYGAAPKDPLRLDGGGGLAGLSADQHWDSASLQFLYACETPTDLFRFGRHRAGLSLKADFEAGFTVDLLYTANPEKGTGIQGFSASGGVDYSFYRGKFLVLAEYLYNGEDSSTSVKAGNRYGFSCEHYLYASLEYLCNDYTSVTAATLFNLSDLSARPVLSADYELFQGLTISASAQFPLDHYALTGSGGRGELGPIPPGTGGTGRFIFTAGARLRF